MSRKQRQLDSMAWDSSKEDSSTLIMKKEVYELDGLMPYLGKDVLIISQVKFDIAAFVANRIIKKLLSTR